MWELSRVDNINRYENSIELAEEITKYKPWCLEMRFDSAPGARLRDGIIYMRLTCTQRRQTRGSSYGDKGEMTLRVRSQDLGHTSSTVAFTFLLRLLSSRVMWHQVGKWAQLRERVLAATRCHSCEYSSCARTLLSLQVFPLSCLGFVFAFGRARVPRLQGDLRHVLSQRRTGIEPWNHKDPFMTWASKLIPDYEN